MFFYWNEGAVFLLEPNLATCRISEIFENVFNVFQLSMLIEQMGKKSFKAIIKKSLIYRIFAAQIESHSALRSGLKFQTQSIGTLTSNDGYDIKNLFGGYRYYLIYDAGRSIRMKNYRCICLLHSQSK